MDTSLLAEFCSNFKIAEKQIKRSEFRNIEIYLPAVNQLRYSCRHLVRALEANTEEENREELRRAISHTQRAIFDASESEALSLVETCYDIKKRLGLFSYVAGKYIPNYAELKKNMGLAYQYFVEQETPAEMGETGTDLRLASLVDSRRSCLEQTNRHVENLKEYVRAYNAAEDDILNEIFVKKMQIVLPVVGTIITVVVSVLLSI